MSIGLVDGAARQGLEDQVAPDGTEGVGGPIKTTELHTLRG